MPFQEQSDEKVTGLSLPVLLLALGIGCGTGTADASSLEQKLHLVERLHQRLRLEPENDPYRDALAEARGLIEQGRQEQARARLDGMLRELARMYRESGGSNQVAQQAAKYRQRRGEVQSLLASLEQWIGEQGGARVRLDVRHLHAMLDKADAAAAGDGVADAIGLMESAYQDLVAELTRLRDKETVNYRLEFAGPEDEYRYEARRYRTYQLLLRMKLAEQVFGDALMKRVAALRGHADRQAGEAETQARRGEFENALATQSAASETLIEALAVVGVYLSK